MRSFRVIACLDVKAGRVVKGVKFESLRDSGDPVELGALYAAQGADELVFLDISASQDERPAVIDLAERVSEHIFIPFTMGGGLRSANDVQGALRAGADKVSLNTAAIERPGLISECAHRFGSQCVVAAIDARARAGSGFEVLSHGGSRQTGLDAVAWATRCVELGAGEILLTSMDRDGTRDGYDLELTGAVSAAVDVPVIASGGAGSVEHLVKAIAAAGADAVLVSGILHEGIETVASLKREMASFGIPVRL